MRSTHPESSTAALNERLNKRRKIAAWLAVISLLGADVAPAAADKKPDDNYNLINIFPDFSAAQQGLHLEGTNSRLPLDNNRAILWYEGDPNLFIQHNTDPGDPNSRCQGDIFSWQNHQLVYKESDYNCGNQDYVYPDGIVFAPDRLKSDEKWSVQGLTVSYYYENGSKTPTCVGTNQYHSYSMGEVTMPNHQKALHIHIIEKQTWLPIFNGPTSWQCPKSDGVELKWYENYFFAKSIPAVGISGSAANNEPGLIGSIGGDGNPAGTHWNVEMGSWQPNTSNLSTGN